ncbi:hypothetical protein IFM89_006894 [Coptis chinensis]|uniref:Uncharacterized protein n=1 Tax=Coptis chinensis TaxID=261450 RepID=A0A835GWX7_9MAGN|nr:hypothetical protein IFM89_006894 [Coptis chinensis]
MIPDTFYLNPQTSSTSWSFMQDKQFEKALVIFPEETPNRWENISSQVPGKTASEVEQHYRVLVDDINAIEAGLIEPPTYTDDFVFENRDSLTTKTAKSNDSERRKGTPWTEEEHKLFLIGLKKYGKGDWRSISRNAVVSRTPTQVASHAQKYFNRVNSGTKEKKRSSIHDITVDEASLLQSNNQNSIVPVNNPSQQLQVPFPNHGAPAGYQGFGFHM